MSEPARAQGATTEPIKSVASAPKASASAPPVEEERELRHAWEPKSTRAFLVCVAEFGDETGQASFSTHDRNDDDLAEALVQRGVPRDRVVTLFDHDAKTENVRARFEKFLAESAPGETLFFYFGSHGSFDRETGEYGFSTYDGGIPMQWAVDAIEAKFQGERAMMFSDSCFSGGLAEVVTANERRVSYAVLTSTGPHNIAYSGWRFIDVILRGLRGDAEVDLDASGGIEWDELGRFARKHMAFVAEGVPDSIRTGALAGNWSLQPRAMKKSDPRKGLYRERKGLLGGRYKVEIMDGRGDEVLVHHVSSVLHGDDTWMLERDLIVPQYTTFTKGAKVELEWEGKWYPGTVLDTFENMTYAHFDGYNATWDQWFGPSSIRASAP